MIAPLAYSTSLLLSSCWLRRRAIARSALYVNTGSRAAAMDDVQLCDFIKQTPCPALEEFKKWHRGSVDFLFNLAEPKSIRMIQSQATAMWGKAA